MDWDRVLAWIWTVLGSLFILGFILQSLNIVLTVIAIALLVILIKNNTRAGLVNPALLIKVQIFLFRPLKINGLWLLRFSP